MQVTVEGNWFLVNPPTAPAAVVGAEALASRMARVLDALPQAALHADEDVEHVHRLRVGCRRAAAALHAFECLAPRPARKLDKLLRRIRRAAGPARDADVLLDRFRKEHGDSGPVVEQILLQLAAERAAVQRRLIDVFKNQSPRDGEGQRGAVARAAIKVEKSLRRRADEESAISFTEFGRKAIQQALAPVAEFRIEDAAPASLHTLRIAAKRLRYSLEIFHDALPVGVAEEVYPDVEEVQERLGKLNDRLSAQARWQGWLADAPANEFAAFLGGLVASEWRAAESIRRDFLGWWTEQRRAPLLGKLAAAAM